MLERSHALQGVTRSYCLPDLSYRKVVSALYSTEAPESA